MPYLWQHYGQLVETSCTKVITNQHFHKDMHANFNVVSNPIPIISLYWNPTKNEENNVSYKSMKIH